MSITIKKMETDEEIRGKAYVHWRSWHEAYTGIVSADYLDKMTLESAEERAFRWTENLLVAKDGERVVGFVGYGAGRDEPQDTGEIYALYILSEYYGTGLGKSLMDAAMAQLSHYRSFCLTALKENKRALRFYEKYGFRLTGEEIPFPALCAVGVRLRKDNHPENG